MTHCPRGQHTHATRTYGSGVKKDWSSTSCWDTEPGGRDVSYTALLGTSGGSRIGCCNEQGRSVRRKRGGGTGLCPASSSGRQSLSELEPAAACPLTSEGLTHKRHFPAPPRRECSLCPFWRTCLLPALGGRSWPHQRVSLCATEARMLQARLKAPSPRSCLCPGRLLVSTCTASA